MAEGPKKRRSVIISRTIPVSHRGPDAVAYDRTNVKFREPVPEPTKVQAEPAKSLDWATRERLKKEQAEIEAAKIKAELDAEEAMKGRRL